MVKYHTNFSVILLFLACSILRAQVVEIQTKLPGGAYALPEEDAKKDDLTLLGKGLLDVHASGQLEASAQMIKIQIGEPSGFSVPFYLFTGAVSSIFGKADENEATAADLISPTGGFINGSFNLYYPLYKSASNITNLKFSTLGGARLVSGRAQNTNDITVFGAGYFDSGLLFQTGAWLANGRYEDGGVFWLQVKFAGTFASKNKLADLFGPEAENPYGFRGELGLLVGDKVNIKIGAFFPQAGKDLPTLDTSAWKIAIDYKVVQ